MGLAGHESHHARHGRSSGRGAREALAAPALWDSLPIDYRHHAHGYTDFWSAYRDLFPEAQHTYCGKESGQTNPIERLVVLQYK